MNTEEIKIKFNEILSDSSIKLIKKILNDSLGYKTEIERVDLSGNENEIFCLIGSFLNRLKPKDFFIDTKKEIRLNNKEDKLFIIDKTRGRIAKELSKIYEVNEIKQ